MFFVAFGLGALGGFGGELAMAEGSFSESDVLKTASSKQRHSVYIHLLFASQILIV
jgi:hypothetical protein